MYLLLHARQDWNCPSLDLPRSLKCFSQVVRMVSGSDVPSWFTLGIVLDVSKWFRVFCLNPQSKSWTLFLSSFGSTDIHSFPELSTNFDFFFIKKTFSGGDHYLTICPRQLSCMRQGGLKLGPCTTSLRQRGKEHSM